MKKVILKSMVAAAVVGVAVAISSVAAFAATSVYNFEKVTNGTYSEWSSSDPTNVIKDDTDLTFSTANANTITAVGTLQPVLRTYYNVSESNKNYLSVAPTEGTLADTTLQAALYSYKGNANKEFIKISDVSKGDTIEVYFFGCDGKGASGKATSIVLTDAAGGTTTKSISKTATDDNYVSSNTSAYVSYVSTGTGDFTISSGADGNRIGVTAIVITSNSSSTIADTVTAIGSDYYAVDSTNKATYIIHAVTSDEMKYATLALEGKSGAVAPTTEVYTSVEFADGSTLSASDINADAIYAVKVTGTDGAAPTATFNWIESK
jgi:hypothetical protein